MTKLLIATPAYGNMFYTPYVRSIMGVQRLLARKKWDSMFMTMSYADIVDSRNFLLTRWYDKTNATHLLFIDADMGYAPELVTEMVELGKPVVGVIAPKRELDLNRLADLARKGVKTERAIARAHNYVFRPIKRDAKPKVVKGFVEVEGCGAGILLIERSCIQAMLEKLPEINDPQVRRTFPSVTDLQRLIRAFDVLTVKGAKLSEDYSFCYRWRQQCDGEIWANIKHRITHIGLQQFAGSYAEVLPFESRVVAKLDSPSTGVARAPDAPAQRAKVSIKGAKGLKRGITLNVAKPAQK